MFLPQYRFDCDYLCLKLSKNSYDTNITKIFEISKFFQTFFQIFLKYFLYCLKNFFNTNITKIFYISKLFLKNFQINHRFGTMERTWYSGCNLGSGIHSVHLLCRCTSIIPIRIVAIYMTDTSLLYPYSLLNQNQTDPINIFSL